jgi:hypothetical protein
MHVLAGARVTHLHISPSVRTVCSALFLLNMHLPWVSILLSPRRLPEHQAGQYPQAPNPAPVPKAARLSGSAGQPPDHSPDQILNRAPGQGHKADLNHLGRASPARFRKALLGKDVSKPEKEHHAIP